MRFFYTGADKYLMEQTSPNKSLGGFISKSQIPNDQLYSIFSGISLLSIENDRKEYKCISLKNTLGETKSNVKITVAYPWPISSKIYIGKEEPTFDENCDDYYFESIEDLTVSPYGTEFNDYTSSFAFCTLTFTTAATKGDTISIRVNGVVIVTTEAYPQDSPTIEDTIDYIVDSFDGNNNYSARKMWNEVSQVYELRIRRNTIGSNSDTVDIVTSGTALAEEAEFAGGSESYLTLSSSLESDKYIGIWLKRQLLPSAKRIKSATDMNLRFGVEDPEVEEFQLVLSWD